jgi:hypothetical protein
MERDRKAGRKRWSANGRRWKEMDMEKQIKKGTRINKEKYETTMQEYVNK